MKIKKIQFISPCDKEIKKSASAEFYPPLGLLQIATYIKQEFPDIEIETIDENVEHRKLDSILDADIVGVSILTPHATYAEKVIKRAKQKGAITIAGNDHASQRAEQLLKFVPELDYIIRGDYTEKPLAELLKKLLQGKVKFDEIPGLSYKKEEDIIHNEEKFYLPGKIPWADRTLIKSECQFQYSEHYNFAYGKYHEKRVKQTNINIAQGCERYYSSRCFFCGIEDLRLRNVTPERVIKEIKYLNDNFGYNYLYIVADDFTSFGKYPPFLLKKLAHRWPFKDKIGLYVYAKADNIVQRKNILHWLKKINVHRLNIGFESGSPEMLKNMTKTASVDINRKATVILKKNKVQLHTSFVLGTIGESENTLKQTFNFIQEIIELSKIDGYSNNIVVIELSILFPIFNSTAWLCMVDERTARENLKRANIKVNDKKLKSLINKYQNLNKERHVMDPVKLVEDWLDNFCKVDLSTIHKYINKIQNIVLKNGIHTGTFGGFKGM